MAVKEQGGGALRSRIHRVASPARVANTWYLYCACNIHEYCGVWSLKAWQEREILEVEQNAVRAVLDHLHQYAYW